MKKILIIAAIIAVPVAGTLILARFVYPGNIAETSENNENAELKTRIYAADLPTVFETVKKIIPTLSTYGSNWKLTGAEIKSDKAVVKTEVPVVVFTDDLILNMKQSDGKTKVDVRSNSRVGQSDFGENRRHVLQILNGLDKKFNAK